MHAYIVYNLVPIVNETPFSPSNFILLYKMPLYFL